MRREEDNDDIAQRLIRLYRHDTAKKKGRFRMSANQFKAIAGRKNLQRALVHDVDAVLSRQGFVLITLGEERPDTIAMLSIQALMKQFQALPDEALEADGHEEDDEALKAKLEALTR